MRFFFNTRRRRSAAAFTLLGWLLVLFVNVAHACVPMQPAHQRMPDNVVAKSSRDADCAHGNGEHGQNACQMFCDAQASDVAKEKSFDPRVDHPILFMSAYTVAVHPSAEVIAINVPAPHPLLFDPTASLRFTRLTL